MKVSDRMKNDLKESENLGIKEIIKKNFDTNKIFSNLIEYFEFSLLDTTINKMIGSYNSKKYERNFDQNFSVDFGGLCDEDEIIKVEFYQIFFEEVYECFGSSCFSNFNPNKFFNGIELHIYQKNEGKVNIEDENVKKTCETLWFIILVFFEFLKKFKNGKYLKKTHQLKSNPITIHILLTMHKKILEKKENEFQVSYIFSGFTNSKEICLHNLYGITNLLIHELIHLFGLHSLIIGILNVPVTNDIEYEVIDPKHWGEYLFCPEFFLNFSEKKQMNKKNFGGNKMNLNNITYEISTNFISSIYNIFFQSYFVSFIYDINQIKDLFMMELCGMILTIIRYTNFIGHTKGSFNEYIILKTLLFLNFNEIYSKLCENEMEDSFEKLKIWRNDLKKKINLFSENFIINFNKCFTEHRKSISQIYNLTNKEYYFGTCFVELPNFDMKSNHMKLGLNNGMMYGGKSSIQNFKISLNKREFLFRIFTLPTSLSKKSFNSLKQ